MKVYIGANPKDGYISAIKDNVIDYNIAFDAECHEILIENTLELLPFDKYLEFIGMWVKKLRKGGKLTVISNNLKSAIMRYANGILNINELNEILYKEGTRSILDCHTVVELLESCGLKIERVAIDSDTCNSFTVIGSRNV